MIIDVSGILKEFGGKIKIDGEVDLPDTDFMGEMYTFKTPISVKGDVTNNGKSLILAVVCSGKMGTQCARCMKDITVDIDFPVEEHLVRSDGEFSEDEDIITFDGHTVELDGIIADNLIMNIEGRYLCKDDCKGLCPVCGQDLNEGECGCSREVIDPRWQGLADLMKNE